MTLQEIEKQAKTKNLHDVLANTTNGSRWEVYFRKHDGTESAAFHLSSSDLSALVSALGVHEKVSGFHKDGKTDVITTIFTIHGS